MPTEKELVTEYLATHPQSRARSILILGKNTCATKQYKCILCNEEGPSYSAKYPMTKRVQEWRAAHVARHLLPQEPQVVQPDADPVVDVPAPGLRVRED